ncbi:MAG: 3-methyl-2-oxobutanoate hydroxymethyltransferase [Chloroflexi bacterium]|nr:3-methyl-2-oxobutanoate hydroxymethyltransferase [Chloroflexota bacterium]|tara:strand:- start:32579 stop:33412 length:834 start_codon:yes stop_codon:yes gene_type:complete
MRLTIRNINEMKRKNEQIPMVTAYDYTSGMIAENAGIPMLLVGDSLGQVVLGHDTTIPVTMEEMIHHTKAVVKGTNKALIVADMPFMSYQASRENAILNAGRLLKEGGAQAVKLEGGTRSASTVRRIVEVGIPVMGHIGLTPQSVNQMGGYRVRGKTEQGAERLIEDALDLQSAGAFAIVLELIPNAVALRITSKLKIPTIGIGAGPHCDGQIQVLHDLLGLFKEFTPKHAKKFIDGSRLFTQAIQEYVQEVKSQTFLVDSQKSKINNIKPEEITTK